jgi:hypothetical protein
VVWIAGQTPAQGNMSPAQGNMTPSVIEIIQDEGDDFSTLSSSIGKKAMAIISEKGSKQPSNVEDGGKMEMSGEQKAEDSRVIDDEEEKSEEVDCNNSSKSDGSNAIMHSDVDSQAYEEQSHEEEEEDDDAFIERLSNMADIADLLDNDLSNVEARESVEDVRNVAARARVEDPSGMNLRRSGRTIRNPKRVEDPSGMNLRRSGRTIRNPKRLIEEMGSISVDDGKTTWKDCLMQVYEFALVSAGIGGGFGVKKYNEALKSNDLDELAKWVQGIEEEHARFLFDDVWIAVSKGDYMDVIPITMTWALKQKASGVVRVRCYVRGFEQIPHIHYDPDSKSSPVTTQAAVFTVFVLLMMNVAYVARIINVKGAFLKGRFSSPTKVLMLEVPQGFRWVYNKMGEEMDQCKKESQPMSTEEVKQRTKEIFQEWMEIPLSERLILLKQQRRQQGGSGKVYLQMQRTEDNLRQCAGSKSVLDQASESVHGDGVHKECSRSVSEFSMGRGW